jgi:hypothetical protein
VKEEAHLLPKDQARGCQEGRHGEGIDLGKFSVYFRRTRAYDRCLC